jgi:hypothetical protein
MTVIPFPLSRNLSQETDLTPSQSTAFHSLLILRRQDPSLPTHKVPNVMKKRMQETILPSPQIITRSEEASVKKSTQHWLKGIQLVKMGILVFQLQLSHGFVITLGDSWCYRPRKPDAIASWWNYVLLFFYTVRMQWYGYIWKYNIRKVAAIAIPVTDMYRRPSTDCEKWTAHLW